MTDVRLTALNPVDSQVYPVACNTSGELIVEQVDPGPDLTITGDLTVNGSGTFDESVIIKGGLSLGNPGIANAVVNSADGVFINIDSDDNSTSDTFQVRHNGSGAGAGDPLLIISENGTANFVGHITCSGDIICSDNTTGLVLTSPNGTNYRLSVANDGTLSTSAT